MPSRSHSRATLATRWTSSLSNSASSVPITRKVITASAPFRRASSGARYKTALEPISRSLRSAAESRCPVEARDESGHGRWGEQLREIPKSSEIEQDGVSLRVGKPLDLPGWIDCPRDRSVDDSVIECDHHRATPRAKDSVQPNALAVISQAISPVKRYNTGKSRLLDSGCQLECQTTSYPLTC